MALNIKECFHVVQNEVEVDLVEGAEVNLADPDLDHGIGQVGLFTLELVYGDLILGAVDHRLEPLQLFIKLIYGFANLEAEASHHTVLQRLTFTAKLLGSSTNDRVQALRYADR